MTTETAIVTELAKECEMEVLENNLTEMFTSWVCYQECPGIQQREDITYTFNTLRNHLRSISKFLNSKKK
ncbi:MAG TPA: hypothetical protein PLC48_08840 [Ferruginibacter sp.]|jgi:hypothetical protein|nr:hypothetical protein [Bacteroidales bacterium]HPH85556.1 hypothetical protein [Ferruginibacter sp.]